MTVPELSADPRPPEGALPRPGDPATLSRDLADFLIELSIALHKNSIYPPGHPLLATAVSGILRCLGPLLATRPSLALGVARRQLVIEGVATDPDHPLLRELAMRLHGHHLGAVRFQQGVTELEIGDFLETVSVDAGRSGRPLGLQPPEALARWPRVRLFPMTFDQLELLDEPADAPDEDDAPDEASAAPAARRRGALAPGTHAAQLWVGLARAALAGERSPDAPAADGEAEAPHSTDPVVVARAIDEHDRDQAYDQVVVGYLLQIAQELRTREGREGTALRKRISRLVATLKPETLRRLLDMGGDLAQRRRFVLDATAGLAVDAVVDLVEAAAQTSQQTVSHSMMRLLTKFAAHAEGGTSTTRPQAEGALREGVQRLIYQWDLDDPNPDAYRRTLEGMSRAPALFATADVAHPAEPERILQMSLETGAVGDALRRAVDALLPRPGLGGVVEALEAAPATHARETVWAHVATQERLRELLAAPVPPVPLLAALVARMRLAAAAPLLDELELPDDARARTAAELLVALGADVGEPVLMRLDSARWATQQRLLAVLARLPEPPAALDAAAWLRHADAGVRREAFRVALRQPAARDRAVAIAVADEDPRVVREALAAALAGCSRQALEAIRSRVVHGALPDVLAALAVRVVAQHDDDEGVTWLVAQAAERGGWTRRLRLRPASAVVVAALEGLAARWARHADAVPVLALARRSDDVALRAASTPRRPSTMLRDALRAIEAGDDAAAGDVALAPDEAPAPEDAA